VAVGPILLEEDILLEELTEQSELQTQQVTPAGRLVPAVVTHVTARLESSLESPFFLIACRLWLRPQPPLGRRPCCVEGERRWPRRCSLSWWPSFAAEAANPLDTVSAPDSR